MLGAHNVRDSTEPHRFAFFNSLASPASSLVSVSFGPKAEAKKCYFEMRSQLNCIVSSTLQSVK